MNEHNILAFHCLAHWRSMRRHCYTISLNKIKKRTAHQLHLPYWTRVISTDSRKEWKIFDENRSDPMRVVLKSMIRICYVYFVKKHF